MPQSSAETMSTIPTNTLSFDEMKSPLHLCSDLGLEPVVAGFAAGTVGLLVGYPLDSLKVLAQTGMTRHPSPAPPPFVQGAVKNMSPALRGPISQQTRTFATSISTSIDTSKIKLRSVASLYSGIKGPLATTGLIQSLNFFVYDSTRRHLYEESSRGLVEYREKDSLLSVGIAAVAAGTCVSVVTSPLTVIKTKQQVMLWSWKEAAAKTLSLPRGIRNFYVGFGAHYYCETVGRAAYFCTYEALKRSLTNGEEGGRRASLPERVGCASISGLACWSAIYPLDAIRARMYTNSAVSSESRSMPDMVKMMYKEGGNSIRLFYRGFGLTVFRAVPISAVALPTYDGCLHWLSEN